MTAHIPNEVTFKMRRGKQIEMGFYCLWCVFISAFFMWMILLGIDDWSLHLVIIMLFLFIGPIAGIVVFVRAIIRSRLTFSDNGIFFKAAFSSKGPVPWQQLIGFYQHIGEIYIKVETPNGKSELDIPISFFAKLRLDNKPYAADIVMNSLMIFAPHLFANESVEKELR